MPDIDTAALDEKDPKPDSQETECRVCDEDMHHALQAALCQAFCSFKKRGIADEQGGKEVTGTRHDLDGR